MCAASSLRCLSVLLFFKLVFFLETAHVVLVLLTKALLLLFIIRDIGLGFAALKQTLVVL